jgi:hypothetical protein
MISDFTSRVSGFELETRNTRPETDHISGSIMTLMESWALAVS